MNKISKMWSISKDLSDFREGVFHYVYQRQQDFFMCPGQGDTWFLNILDRKSEYE